VKEIPHSVRKDKVGQVWVQMGLPYLRECGRLFLTSAPSYAILDSYRSWAPLQQQTLQPGSPLPSHHPDFTTSFVPRIAGRAAGITLLK
jgi:hypothetical protein